MTIEIERASRPRSGAAHRRPTPPARGGLLQRIALLAIAAPRRVLAVAAILVAAAGIFGVPVAKSLSASGFQDPTSESARAAKILTDKFGQGDMQLLFVVTAPDGIDERGRSHRRHGHRRTTRPRSEHVTSVTSAWTVPPDAAGIFDQ